MLTKVPFGFRNQTGLEVFSGRYLQPQFAYRVSVYLRDRGNLVVRLMTL